jgi:ABC-type sugar transport system permease subunit
MIASKVDSNYRNIIKRRKKKIGSDNEGYLFILPFYLFLLFGILLPIVLSAFLSFTDYDLSSLSFIGFKNYVKLIKDADVWISLKNTFFYTFFTLGLSMIAALGIALALVAPLRFKNVFLVSAYLPFIPSMVSVAIIWIWIFEPAYGLLNILLAHFNIAGVNWLYDSRFAMWCIIAVGVWKNIGYNVVIYLAGLQAIPSHLYSAAKIDGANYWQQFYYVTLPLLRPVTFFLFVTGFINNFKVFEQVALMTNGGPMNSTTTIIHQIYNRGFIEYQMGYSSTITVFAIAIIAIITLINFKYVNQGDNIELG